MIIASEKTKNRVRAILDPNGVDCNLPGKSFTIVRAGTNIAARMSKPVKILVLRLTLLLANNSVKANSQHRIVRMTISPGSSRPKNRKATIQQDIVNPTRANK